MRERRNESAGSFSWDLVSQASSHRRSTRFRNSEGSEHTTYVCIYMYLCVYIYTYIYMYLHTYIYKQRYSNPRGSPKIHLHLLVVRIAFAHLPSDAGSLSIARSTNNFRPVPWPGFCDRNWTSRRVLTIHKATITIRLVNRLQREREREGEESRQREGERVRERDGSVDRNVDDERVHRWERRSITRTDGKLFGALFRLLK